jgi:hypothetical protein
VELGALVAEALLAGAESAEVFCGLWDNIVEEVEVDTTGLRCRYTKLVNASRLRVESWQELPLTSPWLVTLPALSTSTVGPVQEQSK